MSSRWTPCQDAASHLTPNFCHALSSGFFTFFTTSMLLSHIQLISIGMTTIESFSLRSQLDKERAMLSSQFGVCAWGKKRRTMKTWTREWGDLKTEGNRWYIGPGAYDEWKRVMGDNPLWWIRKLCLFEARLPTRRSRQPSRPFSHSPDWPIKRRWHRL